ncbi:hypothetical protein BH11MYX4_BH11MYX4_62060 [soil metagenome]
MNEGSTLGVVVVDPPALDEEVLVGRDPPELLEVEVLREPLDELVLPLREPLEELVLPLREPPELLKEPPPPGRASPSEGARSATPSTAAAPSVESARSLAFTRSPRRGAR